MDLERLNQQQFGQFCDFIYQKSGIRIDDRKIALLSNRIRRRLKARDFTDFDMYYRFLTSPGGTGELDHFLDAITTNETFFFRTQHHFDWLISDFISEVVAAHRHGEREPTLQIWSAGCATGAEPYTIAICLMENIFRLEKWSFAITGTDISEESLRDAREGIFKKRALEAVSEKQLRRFFQPVDGKDAWQVRPKIRELVEFCSHNLLKPLPHAPLDCIFIRNVLIYFDRESKQIVVDHLIRALAHNGYLVVGPTEGIYDMLEPLKKRSAFLYQKV